MREEEMVKIIEKILNLPAGTPLRTVIETSSRKAQEEAFVVRLGPMPAFANEVKSS